ncbi:hypothetical protein GCM10011329_11880 [Stakelama pacifica]|nr:hypothetical protein GCM10011329_11880 [Stakelama pacifica]
MVSAAYMHCDFHNLYTATAIVAPAEAGAATICHHPNSTRFSEVRSTVVSPEEARQSGSAHIAGSPRGYAARDDESFVHS